MADEAWLNRLPETFDASIKRIDNSVDSATYTGNGAGDLYITNIREASGQNAYVYIGYYLTDHINEADGSLQTSKAYYSTFSSYDPIIPQNNDQTVDSIAYSPAEENSLRYKFGGTPGLSAESTVSNKIQDIIQSIAQDVEISKMSGQLTYNKVDYKGFTKGEISSLTEETETEIVGTTVVSPTTPTTTGGTTSGGGY